MSSETERLGSIKVVTDNDDGMSKIGDLDGGFDEERLHRFFVAEGEAGYQRLCAHLIYMGSVARRTWHSVRDAAGGHEQAVYPGSPGDAD